MSETSDQDIARIFNNIPLVIKESLVASIDKLAKVVLIDGEALFKSIIRANTDLDIYHLGLFYHSGDWSYCFPTFSSHQGLARVIEHYQRHSVISPEEQSVLLRWSIGDSPHHNDDRYNDFYYKLDVVLREIEGTLDESEEFFDFMNNEIDYYDFLSDVYTLCWNAVTHALKEIRRIPEISNYCDEKNCVISLYGTDESTEIWLRSIEIINGKSIFTVVAHELSEANEVCLRDMALREIKEEEGRVNPPQPSFTMTDLLPVLEEFDPACMVSDDGAILCKAATREFYDYSNMSETEDKCNWIEIFKLLSASKHYDEIDKLYGHFSGPEFKQDNIITQFACLIVKKLSDYLRAEFPNYRFFILMKVDRMSRSLITFFRDRGDGYKFHLNHTEEYPENNTGIEEVFEVIGPSMLH